MITERDILTLVQWLSPSFPVGGFAYSHGIETAIQTGQITTAQDLEDWLSDVVQFGSGQCDVILLRAGYGAVDSASLKHINATALAFCASSERRLETELQGAAFGQTATAIWGGQTEELVYPVAVGVAASRQGIDVTLAASMYLQAMISTLVSAAVRAVPLGQTEGQKVLANLSRLCDLMAQELQTANIDDLQSSAFMSDIAALRHETLQPRIFRS